MNVKKCFAYVLSMFCISVSFAFFFPIGSFADFEEDETIVNEELPGNDEMPLLTSDVPTPEYVTQDVYQENMNNLFDLIDNKLPSYSNAVNITYNSYPSYSIPVTGLEMLVGLDPVFDDFYDWASFDGEDVFVKHFVYNEYDKFPKGTYRISNYDYDIAFLLISDVNGNLSVIPLLEYEYYDITIPYESEFDFFALGDYDYHIQAVTNSLSVGGMVIDDMSNKLDSLQTDIYLLKNAVAVIGFTLLFSVMYPLLTSITHKFMGRKD